jgi:hypothetical protein
VTQGAWGTIGGQGVDCQQHVHSGQLLPQHEESAQKQPNVYQPTGQSGADGLVTYAPAVGRNALDF